VVINKKNGPIFIIGILILFIYCILYIYILPKNTELKGVKVTTYGDSITAQGGWQKILKFRFGFDEVYNRGIGSTTYTKNDLYAYLDADGNYISRSNLVKDQPENTIKIESWLSSHDRIGTIPQDTDVVLIMAGTNDFGYAEIGELSYPYNEDTFKNSVALTVQRVKEHIGEEKLVILMSQLNSRCNDGSSDEIVNSIGLKDSDYVKAVEEVAAELNVPYIDVYNNTIINTWNRKVFIKDTVHPNKIGQIELARVISQGIEDILKQINN